MQPQHEQLTQARALRAAILAAPQVWLPRRIILLEWLEEFLQRASAVETAVSAGDSVDLEALAGFLRKQKVPIA